MDFTAIDTNDAGIDRTEWASATTPEVPRPLLACFPMVRGCRGLLIIGAA